MYIDSVTALEIAFVLLCVAEIYINWRLDKQERYINKLKSLFLSSLDAMQVLANSNKQMVKIIEDVSMLELASSKDTLTKIIDNLKESADENNKAC